VVSLGWLWGGGARAPPWWEAATAPAGAAPLRLAVATALAEIEADPRWQEIGTAWFADEDHVARFDLWAGTLAAGSLLAEEVVVRGGDWLDRRWREGGPRVKHVAVAGRRAGLSPEEFSGRWRAHAGSVGATPIPESARGQAYVQRHVLDEHGSWDAVTEVWFDDVDSLRSRVAWMREALASSPPDDLFGERHLLAVREELLLPG
jgi:hypothetical protein